MGGLPERTESENGTLQEGADVMSQIEEFYPELNLVRLKSIILNWVNKDKYPVSKVTLYRNAETEPCYVLIAELPQLPEEKIKGRQELRQRYREKNKSFSPEKDSYPEDLYIPKFKYTDDEEAVIEAYESTFDCSHLLDWLPQIYEDEPPEEFWKEWMWFNILPGEELDERFVREDTRHVLYGDIDNVSESVLQEKRPASLDDEGANDCTHNPDKTQPVGGINLVGTNYFKRNGDFWEIGYEGTKATVKDSAGVRYIKYLLENPYKPITCIDLFHSYNPPKAKTMPSNQAVEEGLNISTMSDKIYDQRAKEEIGARLKQLLADKDNAESDLESNEIEEEIEKLMAALQGSPKETFSDPIRKKAQSNIKKALTRTYKNLAEYIPELSKYLREHIKPDGNYDLKYTGTSWNILS